MTLDWWNLRNGTDCSKVTTIQGATDYNDGGIVSSGASCEPPANTPFAPYFGTQMITRLGGPGDTFVRATSSGSLLSAHAVKRANGDVRVMLINKDPNNDTSVNLGYSGFTPTSATTVYSYLKNATAISAATTGNATTQVVPAYSVVVVQLRPGGATSSPSASP